MVKNLPASAGDVRNGVQSLGQEDSLDKEMAACSSIPAWKYPMDRGAWQATGYVSQSRTMTAWTHTHTHTHTHTLTHTHYLFVCAMS